MKVCYNQDETMADLAARIAHNFSAQ